MENEVTMKKFLLVLLVLLVLPVWAGCSKSNMERSKDFTHTGCAAGTGTRAGSGDSDKSLLTLKYEDGNLRVTRTNAMLNCIIKAGGEVICETSVDGNVIHYKVYEYEKSGLSANCMCRVAEMTSVVTGLEIGKEYTFDYFCSHAYDPITFVFKKDLVLIDRKEDPWPE